AGLSWRSPGDFVAKNQSMATGLVRAEAADRDRSRARQRGQQVECMAGRWTFQLSTVRVEEAAPHLRIVDPCLLNRPQQAGAWRHDREPDVEIVISLPAAPRHASRRIARRPDAQAFPAPGLVADTESTDVRTTHVTQRTTQSRRRVEFLI